MKRRRCNSWIAKVYGGTPTVKRSYPTSLPSAKFDQAAFTQRLEIL